MWNYNIYSCIHEREFQMRYNPCGCAKRNGILGRNAHSRSTALQPRKWFYHWELHQSHCIYWNNLQNWSIFVDLEVSLASNLSKLQRNYLLCFQVGRLIRRHNRASLKNMFSCNHLAVTFQKSKNHSAIVSIHLISIFLFVTGMLHYRAIMLFQVIKERTPQVTKPLWLQSNLQLRPA